PVKTITGGIYHRCALHVDETVSCWGSVLNGETGVLSDGTWIPPTKVPSLSGIKRLHGAWRNTCAVDSQDRYRCWGHEYVGDGRNVTISPPLNIVLPK